MAWFKKDEADLPEALKGKSQEEIEAIVNRAAELETENATLRTSNAEVNSRFETFGQTLEELKGSVASLRAPPAGGDGGGGGGGDNTGASFLTDPDRAFAERAAPIVGLLLSTSATMAKQQALSAAQMRQRTQKNNVDGMLFEKFDNEISELAKTCSAQQLASAATWTHLFYNVKGRHADELVTQNVEKKGDFYVEDAVRPPSAEVASRGTLTEQEKRIAGKMGVTVEQYLLRKKEMIVGAPESI